MPLLSVDSPFGRPAFALSTDQIATVLDLVCRGVDDARADIKPGMLEVPTTMIVRKAMRRAKKLMNLTNLQIRGEHELEDMATSDPKVLGRIDITLQFLHQFGDEDAYVAIECKRVGATQHELNKRYVSQGVDRFVRAQYSAGHEWGFMLGYVLDLPVETVVRAVDKAICKAYGETARLTRATAHNLALAILEGTLFQVNGHSINVKHILVDLTAAA